MIPPTLLDWLQNAAIALLLAWVVLLSHRASQRHERVAGLETWAGFRDPEYWRARLGTEDGPFVNDEPDLGGPPDCQDEGGFHVAGKGHTCVNCPADLTPVRTP